MKKWNRIPVFLMFFCFSITISKAQVIPDITPNNIAAAVNQIFALHGNQIGIEYDSVYNFIDDLLPDNTTDPDYDPVCTPPVATMDAVNATTLSYSWNAIPSVYGYQASFVKLSDYDNLGNTESESIVTTSTNVDFTSTNGLLLVVFQTKCAIETVSKVDVIIVDKPVFFEGSTEDCNCAYPGEEHLQTFNGGSAGTVFNESDIINFDYTQDGTVGYYSSTIEYENGDVSTFLIKVTIQEGLIIIGIVCEENTWIEDGGNVIYSVAEGGGNGPPRGRDDVYGTISFSEGITFDPADGNSGSMTVTECQENDTGEPGPRYSNEMDENSASAFLNARPNPVRHTISIAAPSNKNLENSNCFLMDSMGNKISLPGSRYTFINGTYKLDVRQLATGTYFFVVQNRGEVMKTKFMKID